MTSHKGKAIINALLRETAQGKSLEEAEKALIQSKQFNHLSVRYWAEKLRKDIAKEKEWRKEILGNGE